MKRMLLIPLLFIVLVGCSSDAKPKPDDVREEVWDEAIQISIALIDYAENDKEHPGPGTPEVFNTWGEEEELSVTENEIKEVIKEYNSNALSFELELGKEETEEIENEYAKSYNELKETFGESNLATKNLDEEFIEHVQQLDVDAKKENDTNKQGTTTSSLI